MKQVKESQPQPNDRYQSTNFNSANGNPGGGRWSNSGGGGGGGFRRPNDGTAIIIHFSLFSLKFKFFRYYDYIKHRKTEQKICS